MARSFAAAIALCWVFLTTCGQAGEEYLSMRVPAHGGKTRVVFAPAPSIRQPHLIETNSAPIAAKACGAVEYIDWKDTCVRRPVHVAGMTLETESTGGFSLAQPFIPRQNPERANFYDILLRELTPD